ncbi:hypothetical protein PUNSTDRAFT_44703 [Punctularia strigosozonata HHB-11173 SS5]|uniref:uncharacterized protein n=1 Tax=Punctularia strigosozonata (strain HHB-11173) TaxID=741275 RepID=UPI00044167B4|nr:uncharacterized protein PUNSTDRAFT_44703 [Punctularia strigosozonata HHB-11173 SS5]EIN09338.1 hypothetical protein PUNSTDRAFT_44703 [Punctularia strigosozonata HHB-11173 SS5]
MTVNNHDGRLPRSNNCDRGRNLEPRNLVHHELPDTLPYHTPNRLARSPKYSAMFPSSVGVPIATPSGLVGDYRHTQATALYSPMATAVALNESAYRSILRAIAAIIANAKPNSAVAVSFDPSDATPTFVFARSGGAFDSDLHIAKDFLLAAANASTVSDIWSFIVNAAPGYILHICSEIHAATKLLLALNRDAPGHENYKAAENDMTILALRAELARMDIEENGDHKVRSPGWNPVSKCTKLVDIANQLHHTFCTLSLSPYDPPYLRSLRDVTARLVDFGCALDAMVQWRAGLFVRVRGLHTNDVPHFWACLSLSRVGTDVVNVPVEDLSIRLYSIYSTLELVPKTARTHAELQILIWIATFKPQKIENGSWYMESSETTFVGPTSAPNQGNRVTTSSTVGGGLPSVVSYAQGCMEQPSEVTIHHPQPRRPVAPTLPIPYSGVHPSSHSTARHSGHEYVAPGGYGPDLSG